MSRPPWTDVQISIVVMMLLFARTKEHPAFLGLCGDYTAKNRTQQIHLRVTANRFIVRTGRLHMSMRYRVEHVQRNIVTVELNPNGLMRHRIAIAIYPTAIVIRKGLYAGEWKRE